jgi:hypothetical protein
MIRQTDDLKGIKLITGSSGANCCLKASSTVAGSFTYTPATGAVLAAGTQALSLTFTPKDTADYTTATATVNRTVNKATSSISWTLPEKICRRSVQIPIAQTNGAL